MFCFFSLRVSFNLDGRYEKCMQDLTENLKVRDHLEERNRWQDNIKIGLKQIRYDDVNWYHLTREMEKWWCAVNAVSSAERLAVSKEVCSMELDFLFFCLFLCSFIYCRSFFPSFFHYLKHLLWLCYFVSFHFSHFIFYNAPKNLQSVTSPLQSFLPYHVSYSTFSYFMMTS
jgi:hypothetical protein